MKTDKVDMQEKTNENNKMIYSVFFGNQKGQSISDIFRLYSPQEDNIRQVL